jgi:acyl-CoA synthetase (AMP-forming)/AMP-acid ligase II
MTTITAPIHRSPLPAPPVGPAVATTFLRHAAADPDAVAVIDGATGETLTRGELAARSAALAAGLRAGGVRPGDLISVAMPNLAWWPVVAMGVWRAGAAVSPLSPLWTADESARVLARAVPRAAIAFAPLAPTVRAALASAGLHDVDLAVLGGDPGDATPIEALMALGTDDPYAEPALEPEDLAAVPFSSGTGGLPKGVCLTHGNLAAGAEHGAAAFRAACGFDERSVVLATAPFFHAIGLVLMLSA